MSIENAPCAICGEPTTATIDLASGEQAYCSDACLDEIERRDDEGGY